MRALTAYFAGAGTVVIAIVAGLGGGLVIADMIHPKSAKQGTEMTRLERHMSSEPVQAKPGPSEPVQYLATPQLSAPVAAVAAAPAPAQPQTAGSESARVQPAVTAAATQPAAQAPPTATPASQPAAPAVQPVAQAQATAPENALAKARDADVKRAVDKEKRKFERRQQWAERRRQRQQQELRAVEIREEIEPRQVFAAEPARTEMPLIRLFGPE
jgi:hypothetical protein